MENKKNIKEPSKIIIDTDSLKDLAICLSGLKDGKGNLLPLGTIVLDNLWNTIAYIRGDVRYTCPKKDDKKLSKPNL